MKNNMMDQKNDIVTIICVVVGAVIGGYLGGKYKADFFKEVGIFLGEKTLEK